jgi:putative ABC transport system ATP-binding protein
LIIADEPTSALDAERQGAFLELLFSQQKNTAAALLMVPHDPRIACQFERVIDLQQVSDVQPVAKDLV